MAELTLEQKQDTLLQAGWTQWTDEVADDSGNVRKVKLNFWKDPIGIAASYRNEVKQFEYASSERRYSIEEALRIERLRKETKVYRAELQAEAARKRGYAPQAVDPTGRPVSSAAELAMRAASEAAS